MPTGQNGNVLQECVDFDRLQQPGELKPVTFTTGSLATKPLRAPGLQVSTAAHAVAGLQTGADFA